MEDRFLLAVLSGCLGGVGCYLLLQSSYIRILLGFAVLSNAANLILFSSSAPASIPPIGIEFQNIFNISDPLPQALILTAIVISFGMVSLMFGIIFKLNQTTRCDDARLVDLEK